MFYIVAVSIKIHIWFILISLHTKIGQGYIIIQQKLYSTTLVSAAIILMLVSIAGTAPFAYLSGGGVSVIDTATNTVSPKTLQVGNDSWESQLLQMEQKYMWWTILMALYL